MRNRIPCQRDAGTRLATALRSLPRKRSWVFVTRSYATGEEWWRDEPVRTSAWEARRYADVPFPRATKEIADVCMQAIPSSDMYFGTLETHIPKGIVFTLPGKHIPVILVPQTGKHIFLVMCVSLPAQHISILICFFLHEKHISLVTWVVLPIEIKKTTCILFFTSIKLA